jgi:hypothetical protein
MMTCWDLHEFNRAVWLARRFINKYFPALQPADRDDLEAEAICIALAANTFQPEIHYLHYQLIRKCIQSAGLRLGLLTLKSHATPTTLLFSDLDDSISYNMPEVERETYKKNVVDINAWKARRVTHR